MTVLVLTSDVQSPPPQTFSGNVEQDVYTSSTFRRGSRSQTTEKNNPRLGMVK